MMMTLDSSAIDHPAIELSNHEVNKLSSHEARKPESQSSHRHRQQRPRTPAPKPIPTPPLNTTARHKVLVAPGKEERDMGE